MAPTRTIIATLVAAFAFLGVAAGWAATNTVSGRKDEFQTSVPSAILLDADSGSVLFEKTADQPVPPGSLAKLMTAEVVFHNLVQGEIKIEQELVISEDAWRRGGAPSHTTSMFAPLNSRVRVEDLLRGLIVQSANDAAIALAQGISANETAFAIAMNQRAKDIGLTRSNFTNATGLPDRGLVVSVRDLGRLAQHIQRNYPQYVSLYAEREFTWNRIRQQNRNPLLAMNIGAEGMATGFTSDGGYGLVGVAAQNALRLIVVVAGAKSERERADEARRLLEWGFRSFEYRLLFAEGQTIGEAKVFGGDTRYVPLIGTGTVSLLVPKSGGERLVARIVYSGPVPAPVERGQVIAKLRVSRGEQVALEVPLAAAEAVARGGVARRAFDAADELIVGLIRTGASQIPKAR